MGFIRTCALGQRADRFPIKWTHLIGKESPKSRPLRLDSGEPGVLQSQLISTSLRGLAVALIEAWNSRMRGTQDGKAN